MKPNQLISISPEELFIEAKKIKSVSVEKAILKAQEALKIAQDNNVFEIEFEIHLFLCRTFRLQGEAFESIEQLNKAYRIVNHEFSQDKSKLSLVFREYGSLYSDFFRDHAVALDYLRKSLSLSNTELKAPLYNNIGCQYVLLEQYDKANYYLLKGKQLSIELNDQKILSFIYENFGQMYSQERKKSAAIESYLSGIESAKKAIDLDADPLEVNYIYCYNLIGLANVYLDHNELQKVQGLIQEIYTKSIHSKLQSCWSEAAIIEGSLMLKNNNIEAYQKLFEKAIKFCTKNALHNHKETWLQNMIDLCERQENYKEALNYSKKLIANKADRETKTKAVNIAKVLENKEREILKLENQNRETQLQKEQLEQFAYIVAHDLKTPLSNISNFVGLFAQKYGEKIDKENQYYLDFILNSSRKLHLMFDELLQYVKVEELKDKTKACNVEQIINEIYLKHQKDNPQKKGFVDFGALPKVKMHESHLNIILSRMIDNGIKFSKNDPEFYIRIEVIDSPEEYLFYISDKGIGIKEKFNHKIFDLFKQLDKINYEGLGMGLAICKKIIHMYGGKIDVSTNEWGGATFQFNIPKTNYLK